MIRFFICFYLLCFYIEIQASELCGSVLYHSVREHSNKWVKQHKTKLENGTLNFNWFKSEDGLVWFNTSDTDYLQNHQEYNYHEFAKNIHFSVASSKGIIFIVRLKKQVCENKKIENLSVTIRPEKLKGNIEQALIIVPSWHSVSNQEQRYYWEDEGMTISSHGMTFPAI